VTLARTHEPTAASLVRGCCGQVAACSRTRPAESGSARDLQLESRHGGASRRGPGPGPRRLKVGARETIQHAREHRGSKGARRNRIAPDVTLWDERVLRESTDGHGSESPSAPALCAMCIFARCNGVTAIGRKPPPDRTVASWVRRSLGTCNKTRRHGPSGVLDSRKGRQGGYRRAHTCMFFLTVP
jgi:hypothetical protein